MTITDRVIDILRVLRRYKFVTTAQIRAWVVPHDKDGSITREVLRKMRAAGLARRLKAEVHDPLATSSVPVWIPTESGCCVLATRTGDVSYLLDSEPNTHAWTQFAHFVAVSGVMHSIDRALSAQSSVRLGRLYFEHDLVNPDEADPRKKYKTYTVVREESGGKKIVCVPDAAFEIIAGSAGQYRRAYYLELERGTDTPTRIAAKKSPGYAGLYDTKKFRLHFPEAQDMRVLCVCAPGPAWRDTLRRAVATKPGAEWWLFCSLSDVIPESFLHAPVIYGPTDGPKPFVKPSTPATSPTAGMMAGSKKEPVG